MVGYPTKDPKPITTIGEKDGFFYVLEVV
jgi:hypothetical protein